MINKEVTYNENCTGLFKFNQKVNSFSHELEQFDNDFDLVSGRYIVDAKSVMGIFSLDLNEPTTLNIHATGSEMGPILEAIKPYIVSEDPK